MNGSVRSLISAHSTAGVVVCLTLFLMILFASTGHAQWQSFDRPGEDFRALFVADSVVYALSSPYAIHSSRDYGMSWYAHECRVSATRDAFCLAFLDGVPIGGTSNGSYVYKWGIYPTVRQAVTGVRDDIQAVVSTRRGKSSTWYLGGFGGGVRRSTNKGDTWTLCNEGLTDLNITSLLTIAAADDTSQVLFAGTYGGGVFRSDDDGLHWTISGPGLADLHVYALIAHGDTLYAAHSGGQVSRSSDAGSTWSTLGPGLPFTDILSLARMASGEERYVYAGTIDRGVWRYTESGGTWEPVNTGLTSMRISAIVAVNDVLVLGTDRRLYRSTDLGLTWHSADSGAIPLVNAVCAVSLSPGTPATRILTVSNAHYSFIEAYYGGAFLTATVSVTDDMGASWTTVPFYPGYLLPSAHITFFATVYNRWVLLFSTWVWESDRLRCVLSTDRGSTWGDLHLVAGPVDCHLSGVAMRDVPAEKRVEILITTSGGPWPGMVRSLDSGRTWSPLGLPNNEKIQPPLVSQGSLVYAASNSSALRSSDGGHTWDRVTYNGAYPKYTPAGGRSIIPAFNLLHANSTRLFARVVPAILPGDPGGLYVSTDHGTTWTPAGFTGQLVDRIIESDSVLFALQNGRVFASRTDTLLWKDVSGELTTDSIVVISASPEYLVALTEASDRVWYRPMTGIKEELNAVDPTSTPGTSSGLPATATLLQNYPNPFNPSTTIGYQVPVSGHVRLSVFDLLGREVAVLVNERKEAGRHSVTFKATRLASGVYFYRLSTPGRVATRRMNVLR